MKTYITFLKRNKMFAMINVAGLSISLMFVLIITNMVVRQLTKDDDLENIDRIYCVANNSNYCMHYNMGDRLKSALPEIEDWCAVSEREAGVTCGDKAVKMNFLVASRNFFRMFSFRMLTGTADGVFDNAYNAVLTIDGARKLFGSEENAVGQRIKFDFDDENIYTVSGVCENFSNSQFDADINAVIPFEAMRKLDWFASDEAVEMNGFGGSDMYFLLAEGADIEAGRGKLEKCLQENYWAYFPDDPANMTNPHWFKMKDIYFSDLASRSMKQGSYTFVVIFLIVGVLILVMAVFNYICMSVAQTSYRAKEMAMRRLLGSQARDVFWRMIGESALFTSCSFVIALLLARLVEPYAMDLLDTRLDIIGDLSLNMAIGYIVGVIALALVAGFVPASIVSHYNPLDVVKGNIRRKTKMVYLRLLYVVQSGMSVAVLTCAVFFSLLVNYMRNEPLGYSYGNVIRFERGVNFTNEQKQALESEMKKLPFVKNISFCSATPADGGYNNYTPLSAGDSAVRLGIERFWVDSVWLKIFDIEVLEDRHMYAGDNPYAYFGSGDVFLLSDNVFDYFGGRRDITRLIGPQWTISVAGRFRPIKQEKSTSEFTNTAIKIIDKEKVMAPVMLVETDDKGNLAEYMRKVSDVFNNYFDGYVAEPKWYADIMDDFFEEEFRIEKLFTIFTFMALLISLLGLTAMSVYLINQRKRDIAIRKVFGSDSRREIMSLLRFCMFSLLISMVIAIPVSYYGCNKLAEFVNCEKDYFIVSFVCAFVIVSLASLATVSLIGHKFMNENPAENLKTE